MKQLLMAICCLALGISPSFAQQFDPYLSPGVTLGYTFGGQMNYGLELDAGIFKWSSASLPSSSGLNVSLSRIHTRAFKGKSAKHFMRSVNLIYNNRYAQAKAGLGRVSFRSGYRGARKCYTDGFNWEVIANNGNPNLPWIGYKQFHFFNYKWYWEDTAYRSLFLAAKYNACPDCYVIPINNAN